MRAGNDRSFRYGQVWTIGTADRGGVVPPVPHLVVSSDLYNECGLGVIAAEVFGGEMTNPDLHEPIPGVGSALLDVLAWYPTGWLVEHVGDLPADRHREVARLVRNLIGNG